MNGYYAEKNAEEALKLAKENAAELKVIKDTLGTLIAWLEMDLGSHCVKELLNKLSQQNADGLGRRHQDSEST